MNSRPAATTAAGGQATRQNRGGRGDVSDRSLGPTTAIASANALIGTFDGAPAADPNVPGGGAANRRPIAARSALILEDNVTIAFDLEAMLHDLGIADVVVAASLEDARGEAARRSFDVYLLDINLGDTTSIPLAEELVAAGKPVMFTTGYGEVTDLPESMRGVPILDKPYGETMLAERLAAIR